MDRQTDQRTRQGLMDTSDDNDFTAKEIRVKDSKVWIDNSLIMRNLILESHDEYSIFNFFSI